MNAADDGGMVGGPCANKEVDDESTKNDGRQPLLVLWWLEDSLQH